MYGIWIGIPLGFVTFLYFADQLIPFFHDTQTGTVAAIAAGLCVWFFCRGSDILNDLKLDNPLPFDSHESIPLVLGKIHEFLKEAQVGPYNWQIRTLDTEETRIMAVMKFQEFITAVLPGAPTQLDRLILLHVYLEPKDKARPATSDQEAPGTQITMKWHVDSAVHRTQVNQIITDTTRRLQELVGAKTIEARKPQHPLMPPQWILALLACSLVFGLVRRAEFAKQQAAAAEARDRTEQGTKERREKSEQQWQQQQQNGFGVSPNNPFAPQLAPAPLLPPAAQSNSEPAYGGLLYGRGTSPPANSK